MVDSGIKISLPGVDVQEAQSLERSLDMQHPIIKIDSQANPSHYVTLRFYFAVDLPATGPPPDTGSEWIYDYMIEPKKYLPTLWAYYETDDTTGTNVGAFGPLNATIAQVTAGAGARLFAYQMTDRVRILWEKFSNASDPGNYDLSGRTYYVHLYIFEEEAK